jgi:hypothetical protein
MGKAYELGIYSICCVLVFDTVEGKYLDETLQEFGVSKKCVILVEISYVYCDCKVRIQGHMKKVTEYLDKEMIHCQLHLLCWRM